MNCKKSYYSSERSEAEIDKAGRENLHCTFKEFVEKVLSVPQKVKNLESELLKTKLSANLAKLEIDDLENALKGPKAKESTHSPENQTLKQSAYNDLKNKLNELIEERKCKIEDLQKKEEVLKGELKKLRNEVSMILVLSYSCV